MLFLLLSFYIDCPFRFSIYLFNFLTLFQVFDLPFYIFYVFFFFFGHKNEVPYEAPSCEVQYNGIRIGGHIKVMPVHVS